LSFQNEATYTTLLSPSSLHGDIIFRKTTKAAIEGGNDPESVIILGIHGARGTSGETDFARLLDYGRTTTVDLAGTRSGVLQIDRVLEPWIPDWWNAWGWAVTGGLFGGVGVVAFWRVIYFFWQRSGDEATYEPLDGGNDDDDDR
jgi:solute carrier family 25 carnitine/acylcarnitine transporter 20/29